MDPLAGVQRFRALFVACTAPVALLLGSCASPHAGIYMPTQAQLEYRSAESSFGGFNYREATDFVEFCVELDNQDDRYNARRALNAATLPSGPQRTDLLAGLERNSPHIDPTLWDPNPVFDSRQRVAEAYVAFKALPTLSEEEFKALPDDDPRRWFRLFGALEKTASAKKIDRLDVHEISSNPDLNGFGPWQNAWLMYQGVGKNAGRYAIVIRGTVFSNQPSAFDDVYFQPVIARGFRSRYVSFSDAPAASVHSGFAHAAFSLLLDLRFGILPALASLRVPDGAKLYIVGHSQGAGIATLVHAALHYGMRDAELEGDDALGLKGRNYQLKSYVFAQPKPGNFDFAASFARITQYVDNAIVINNNLDPVTQVPLTLESTGDLAADFGGGSTLARFVRWISSFGAAIRGGLGAVLERKTREHSAGFGRFYKWKAISPLNEEDAVGSSWNFMSAGRVIWVYGLNPPPAGSDDFFQHHATTYRVLVCDQLGSEGTRPCSNWR